MESKQTSQRPDPKATKATDNAPQSGKTDISPDISLVAVKQGRLSHQEILLLQRTIGNRAVSKLLVPTIQRDDKKDDSEASERSSVEMAIKIFDSNAAFHKSETTPLTQADFDSSIKSWYPPVVHNEQRIDNKLKGDADLKKRLRASYTAAIQALMARAAKDLGKNQDDLYRENNGQIPMWAWQTAHRLESGFSTPLAENQAVDPLSGEVNFSVNGMGVKLLPDGKDSKVGAEGAETRINLDSGGNFGDYDFDNANKITRFTPPPALKVTIQTFYGNNSSSSSTSGYGRGTTDSDKEGGKTTPRSTSLGHHEGNHGLDYVNYLTKNPPPRFTGAINQKVDDYKKALTTYKDDIKKYKKALDKETEAHTDQVGYTMAQFNQAHP